MKFWLSSSAKYLLAIVSISFVPILAHYGTMDFILNTKGQTWHRTEKLDFTMYSIDSTVVPPKKVPNDVAADSSEVPKGFRYLDLSFQANDLNTWHCLEMAVLNATKQVAIYAKLNYEPEIAGPGQHIKGSYKIISGTAPVIRIWMEGGTDLVPISDPNSYEVNGYLFVTQNNKADSTTTATVDIKEVQGATHASCTTGSGKTWVEWTPSFSGSSAVLDHWQQ